MISEKMGSLEAKTYQINKNSASLNQFSKNNANT